MERTEYVYMLLAVFSILIICKCFAKRENFVAIGEYEAPETTPEKWSAINEKFGTLMQMTNAGVFSYPIKPDGGGLPDILLRAINAQGVGNFRILSVGEETGFTLLDVLVQETNTLAVTRFSRIDFIMSSINPYVVEKLIMLPSAANMRVQPMDEEDSNLFELQNPLHLFEPYRTSADLMVRR